MGMDFSFNESQTLSTMIDGLYARPGLRALSMESNWASVRRAMIMNCDDYNDAEFEYLVVVEGFSSKNTFMTKRSFGFGVVYNISGE